MLKGITPRMVRSLGAGRFVDWVASDVVEALGGILVFWDSRVLQLVEVEESRFSLSCKFRNCVYDFTSVFTSVYGPTFGVNKELLWEELGAIKGLWGEPWGVGGISTLPDSWRRGIERAE